MGSRTGDNTTNTRQAEKSRFLSMEIVVRLRTAMTNEIRRIQAQDLGASYRYTRKPRAPAAKAADTAVISSSMHAADASASRSEDATKSETLSTAQKVESQKKISQFWRNCKIKQRMIADPYGFYLSMMDQNDEARLITQFMYGKHVAEISIESSDRINNPFLLKSAGYHRFDTLSAVLINNLYSKYGIAPTDRGKYDYIPVVLLSSLNIESITRSSKYNKNQITVLKKPGEKIGLLKIDLKKPAYVSLLTEVRSLGLIASGWDIAQSYYRPPIDVATNTTPPARLKSNLPYTKSDLLNSEEMKKLRKISISVKYPTRLLARSIAKMLDGMTSTISEDALKRIHLIIDIANTFYSMNYSRYSFCVYSIIHEISLEMIRAQRSDPDFLEENYQGFLKESEEALSHALGTNKADLTESRFFASPAYSGANAYGIVHQLINRMTVSGSRPKVHFFDPVYYEFINVETTKTEEPNEAIQIFDGSQK